MNNAASEMESPAQAFSRVAAAAAVERTKTVARIRVEHPEIIDFADSIAATLASISGDSIDEVKRDVKLVWAYNVETGAEVGRAPPEQHKQRLINQVRAGLTPREIGERNG